MTATDEQIAEAFRKGGLRRVYELGVEEGVDEMVLYFQNEDEVSFAAIAREDPDAEAGWSWHRVSSHELDEYADGAKQAAKWVREL